MSLTALFNGLRKPRSAETKKMLLMMKLTAIIIFAACMQVSAKGFTQTVTLSLKSSSLVKAFAEIERQTGYSFVYGKEQLANARAVDIDVKEEKLETVLALLFKDQPLTYTITGKYISIKQKQASPNSLRGNDEGVTTQPPPIDITGKVTDENGNLLIGASVKVKNSNKGTTTNNDGVFVLKGVNDDATLEISFVGFETYSVAVNNKTSIIASLKIKPESLNEVVINKGYYTEKQRFSVGNVGKITAKDIEKQPVANPLLALQGRIPGIEITQLTGLPGTGIKVQIQGINSIGSLNKTVGTDPLFVIDGVPYPSQLTNSFVEGMVQGGSPLSYINSADIESIDVLKDADATAIYGSRAANGAILITTKKGKAGRNSFSVNLQQGWGKVTRHVDMMNTRQYLDMRYEAYKNAGIDIQTLTPNGSNYDLTLWDTTRYTDWQKTLIGGTAKYTNVSAGMSGGTANIQYLLGGTYSRQTTVFPGSFDDKVGSLHFNTNVTSNNQKLKVQITGSYSYDQNHLPGTDLTGLAVKMEPDAPTLYNANGTLNWAPNAAGNSSWTNPLAYTVNKDFDNTTKNLVSNVTISYNIQPGLVFRSSFGYTDLESNLYLPTRLEVNRPENRSTSQRIALFGDRSMTSWIVEPQLQYNRKIGKGKLEGLIGSTIQKSSSSSLSVRATGFSTDLLMKTLKAATSITAFNTSLIDVNRFNALFGRLNYNWNDKYIINLTGRRDGSNKFGDNNKFHNFWGVGAGWIFSGEKWIQEHLPFLSFGKVKTSYGTTGNDQIPSFSYLNLYTVNNPNIPYENNLGLNPSRIPNPDLQWEETRKWQSGLEFGLMNDQIVINATYSYNRSSNQLLSYVIPNFTGFSSISKNLPAVVQNTGWEFLINAVIVKSKNFNWNSSINMTIPHNKVLSFPGIEFTSYAKGFNGVIVGQPIGVTKVTKYYGVDSSSGQYLFLDKNGKQTMYPDDPDDANVLISNLPRLYGGWTNSINYKGFQLDVLVQIVRKKGSRDLYYYNGVLPPGQFSWGNSNQLVSVLNHWQKSGDNAKTGIYSPDGNINNTYLNNSDAWYTYDASYIRLKNLSLSWQLPGGWLQKTHLKNARLYVHGQNILTKTKYSGLDPETMSSESLPPLRMWTIGGQIEF
jgi:TonB-linked SusC/RagA family outer membrane protein